MKTCCGYSLEAPLDGTLFPTENCWYFFLFLHENICCGYALEAPQGGASNEYPQHMFSWRCCGYALEAPQGGASNEYPQHMFSWSASNEYLQHMFSWRKVLLMSTHNICFHGEIRKLFTWHPLSGAMMYIGCVCPHNLVKVFTECSVESQSLILSSGDSKDFDQTTGFHRQISVLAGCIFLQWGSLETHQINPCPAEPRHVLPLQTV